MKAEKKHSTRFVVFVVLFTIMQGCSYLKGPGYSIEKKGQNREGEKVRIVKYRSENGSRTLSNADAASFKVLEHETYAIDKNRAYHKGEVIAPADLHTFISLSHNYAKDLNYVYYTKKIILDADTETFEIISEMFSKDKNKVFKSHRTIPGADVKTFEVYLDHFSRDVNYYYYDIIPFLSSKEGSLEVIGMGYSKTDQQVFFGWYDFETIYNYPNENDFKISSDLKELVGADPQSFSVIEIESTNSLNRFAKDTTFAYWQDQIIESANPETFEHVSGHLTRDDQSYFYLGEKMEGVDYESFEVNWVGNKEEGYTSNSLAKDTNQVYRGNALDTQLTPETLRSRSSSEFLITAQLILVFLLNLIVAWKLRKRGCLFSIAMIVVSFIAYGFIMMFVMAVPLFFELTIVATIASGGVPILIYALTKSDTTKLFNPPKDTEDFLNNPRYSYSRGKILLLIVVVVIAIISSVYNWLLLLF
ncbi:MAG: DKNYY domain-containing protein [Cyclobacteriaceae bacterium]